MRIHSLLRKIMGIVVLAAMCLPAQGGARAAAVTLYVATTGSDSIDNDCKNLAASCATINYAISKAGTGDTIYIASGTYKGIGDEVVLLSKNLTLSGGWDALTFTQQTGFATIDGESARRGITVQTGVSAIIERFEVTRGSAIYGGGIINGTTSESAASLTLRYNNIHDNAATQAGGGIANLYGDLKVENSAIHHNQAPLAAANAGGGGIYNYQGGVILTNTTVSNNTAAGYGGGVSNISQTNIQLSNTTVNQNASPHGGGIYGPATLKNSLLAGNTLPGGTTPQDCAGAVVSSGYNLIGSTTGCTYTAGTGDQANVLAKVAVFEGAPGYHPLLPGSPAIDAGDPVGCSDFQSSPLLTDQRGKPRFGRCDIGAYELQPLGFSTKMADHNVAHRGETVSFMITLTNAGNPAPIGVLLTDTLPANLTYVIGSATASQGEATYTAGAISWFGTIAGQGQVYVTFSATVGHAAPLDTSITNTAEIQGGGEIFRRDASVRIDPFRLYNPVVRKPCAPWVDDFSNPGSGWDGKFKAGTFYTYEGGEYRILVGSPSSSGQARPNHQETNFTASVDLRNITGTVGSYGIAFGIATDWSSFYTLEIHQDGWFGIYRYDPGGAETYKIIQAFSPAVHQGSAVNQITVTRRGTSIQAFANGQLLATVDDPTYTGSLYLGLPAWTYQDSGILDVRFDNFTVYQIGCGG